MITKLIESIKLKADNTSTNSKTDRARKGAYVDCLIMAKEYASALSVKEENEKGVFKSLYDVLLDGLKGKRVRLRSYKCENWEQFEYDGKPEDGKIIKWTEKKKYIEWTGVVDKVLCCDNSHADIIFSDKHERTTPGKEYLQDCYNWHMMDYVEILPHHESSETVASK